MKGDFSRQTFDPKKHYSAVLMQQGRVQVDADWNEQQAIHQHRIETEAKDVIGQCGAPQIGGGFKIDITPDSSNLTISPGRIYVDGILCELEATAIPIMFPEGTSDQVQVSMLSVDNHQFQTGQWVEISAQDKNSKLFRIGNVDSKQPILILDTENSSLTDFHTANNPQLRRLITYTAQPDYPHPDNDNPLKLTSRTYLVYLDVWQQHITALDDAHLREVALGGPDTATRSKTVWQVKLLPLQTPNSGLEAYKSFLMQLKVRLEKLAKSGKDSTTNKELENFVQEIDKFLKQPIEEVEVDDPSGFQETLKKAQDLLELAKSGKDLQTNAELEKIVQEIANIPPLNCGSQFAEWDELTAPSTGTLNAHTQPDTNTDNACLLPSSAGYQRLENQLYRVEIHQRGSFQSGSPSPVTLKWSRDNGSVATEIKNISGQNIEVHDVGPDDILGFANGQWVEVVDDRSDLNGQPGQLVKIKSVNSALKSIEVETPPDLFDPSHPNGVDLTRHPKLRRWDQKRDSTTEAVMPMTSGWLPVEGGIEVQFSDGTYKTGDYWLIPARTATAEIEWPPYTVPNINPIPQPSFGIQHHFCRLALIFLDKDKKLNLLSDCRALFPSVTELTSCFYVSGDGQEAMPNPIDTTALIPLAQPLQVRVANGRWPIAGATVRFLIKLGKGRLRKSVGDGTVFGNPIDVLTESDGIASCSWELDSTTQSQQVEASLLDASRNPVHGALVRFNANLSYAEQVAYDPSNCPKLSEAKVRTVQQAIDQLCQLGDHEPGIHIKEVVLKNRERSSLLNDTNVSVSELVSGIVVVCDQNISSEIVKGKPTCFVTLDMPFPFTPMDQAFWYGKQEEPYPVIGFQPLILAADVLAKESLILWTPTRATQDWLQKRLFQQMKEFDRGDRILAHLTLKGNFIWAQDDSSLYLDGEAFGEPNRDNPNAISLHLPSGDGRRGGDFEMWFWLVKPIELTEVTLSQTKVEGGVTLQGEVILSDPAPDGGDVVALSSNKPTVATVPSRVMVAAGSDTASFQVSTKQVNATTKVVITASREQVNRIADLTVQGVQLLSVTLNPPSLNDGNPSQGTVTLSGPAPAGGAVVTLASDNPTVASVPPNITVAAGLQTVSFTVSTHNRVPTNSSMNVVITASREEVKKTGTLTVKGPKLT